MNSAGPQRCGPCCVCTIQLKKIRHRPAHVREILPAMRSEVFTPPPPIDAGKRCRGCPDVRCPRVRLDAAGTRHRRIAVHSERSAQPAAERVAPQEGARAESTPRTHACVLVSHW
jgi:hypothetical protein